MEQMTLSELVQFIKRTGPVMSLTSKIIIQLEDEGYQIFFTRDQLYGYIMGLPASMNWTAIIMESVVKLEEDEMEETFEEYFKQCSVLNGEDYDPNNIYVTLA